MFPGDELSKLLEVVRLQALSIERLTSTHNGTVGSLWPKPKRPHVPRDPRFRVWSSFCAYFQNLERTVRRDHQLQVDDRLPKEMLCAASGELVAKSLTRIMVETYGLKSGDWPPSTWPETPPRSP